METLLIKGALELCFLYYIRDKEMYGYDLIKLMRQHYTDVNEGTLYAVLRGLYADGSVEIKSSEASNGSTRKIYSITDTGRVALQHHITVWNRIQTILKEIGL